MYITNYIYLLNGTLTYSLSIIPEQRSLCHLFVICSDNELHVIFSTIREEYHFIDVYRIAYVLLWYDIYVSIWGNTSKNIN